MCFSSKIIGVETLNDECRGTTAAVDWDTGGMLGCRTRRELDPGRCQELHHVKPAALARMTVASYVVLCNC